MNGPVNPIDFILHIDSHLLELVSHYGAWVYLILFLIVFAETGLVVTPFLPGDAMLFAVGALTASGALDPWVCSALIMLAAFLGDNSNYWIGRKIGPKVFAREDSLFFHRKHLQRTEQYYNQYGSRTVIIARFLPIVRTFAPFVAGIGQMPYARFIAFSTAGSVLWVVVCLGSGYLFGNIPVVQQHFSLIVLGIVAVSMSTVAFGALRQRLQAGNTPAS